MRHFLWSLVLVFLAAAPAWSAPSLTPLNRPFSVSGGMLRFGASDASDSPAIGVSGFCTVRAELQGSDAISLYAITSSSTAASSGTLLKAFSASTSPANPVYTFTASTQWVKAVATSSTTGGSRLVIECSPLVGTGGGSSSDADGDGYYEVAYLWDADGDGSTYVTCTADATPDIGCKAAGEIVYRDLIDDVNCAVHGCGLGQMEYDGTLILGEAVYIGFPCWDAGNEGNHTAANAEVSDQYHDSTGDTAYANCPLDGDGKALTVISFQDWGGTLLGSGTDARELHRGLMDSTLKRDKGTYVVDDRGPWHSSASDSVWFGGGVDFYRMISAGFTTNASNASHQTGGTAGDGDSKGWWKVYADANWDLWGNDNSLCLLHSGGTALTDYKTASTVSNLERGDTLLVPVKVNSSAANYNYFEVRVRDTPATTCGVSNLGLRVPLGGAINSTALLSKSYPAFAASTLLADGQIAVHARSDYHDTNVTIANMSLEPQDYWNEVGGRCTSSGTPFRANRAASGTVFSVSADNSNTDFSCDTGALIGFWGGGRIRLDNVNIKNFHFYPLDGGSSGGTHIASNVRWLYGQGGPAWDSGNGWQVRDSSIEMSTFESVAFSILGPGFHLQNFVAKNSRFNTLSSLQPVSEGSRYENIRTESSQFDHIFLVNCGVRRSTFRDLYITGRGWTNPGGIPAGMLFDCSTTSTPITENVVDGFVEDPPGLASNDKSAPSILLNASSGNSAAILGNVFTHVRAPVYSSGTAGLQGCLFSAYDFAPGGAPDDAGESILFTNNYFSESSVPAGGRVFCVSNAGGVIAVTDSDAGTPAWGDPVGCGNMDGGVVYADENCI